MLSERSLLTLSCLTSSAVSSSSFLFCLRLNLPRGDRDSSPSEGSEPELGSVLTSRLALRVFLKLSERFLPVPILSPFCSLALSPLSLGCPPFGLSSSKSSLSDPELGSVVSRSSVPESPFRLSMHSWMSFRSALVGAGLRSTRYVAA